MSEKDKDVRVDIAVSPKVANGARDAAVRNQNHDLLAKVIMALIAKMANFVEEGVDVSWYWMVRSSVKCCR